MFQNGGLINFLNIFYPGQPQHQYKRMNATLNKFVITQNTVDFKNIQSRHSAEETCILDLIY